jgi:uncharacterized PurR-regulated membrane protein YhhQ (DUF165 family)
MMSRKVIGLIAFTWFLATIFVANQLVETYGPVPVGFGLMAPAGVYVAGLAFTLRDIVQDTLDRFAVVLAILGGAAISALISTDLAVASGVAFLVSEALDFVVYTPIREGGGVVGRAPGGGIIYEGWRPHPYLAVLASNTVGLVVDSVLFLWLAFGSLEFFWGQVVGKGWVTLAALPLVWGYRRVLLPRFASA